MEPVTERFETAVGILANRLGLTLLAGVGLLVWDALTRYLFNERPYPPGMDWNSIIAENLMLFLRVAVIIGAALAPFGFEKGKVGGGIGSMMGAVCGVLVVLTYYVPETPQLWALEAVPLVLMAIGGLTAPEKPGKQAARTVSN